jgi:hypothetical protein
MAAVSGSVGEQWRKPLHPPVHGDVIDLHAALDQEFLNIAVGQVEPQIPAHRDNDHLRWKPEAGERRLRRRPRTRADMAAAASVHATPDGGEGMNGTRTTACPTVYIRRWIAAPKPTARPDHRTHLGAPDSHARKPIKNGHITQNQGVDRPRSFRK